MKYSELTVRYFETAPNAGELGPGSVRGAAGDRARGTWVQFDLRVASAVIQAASFQAFGCPHTIAIAAWLAERAVGTAPNPDLPESVHELCRRFDLPIEKMGRLLIIEDAWMAAQQAAAAQSL